MDGRQEKGYIYRERDRGGVYLEFSEKYRVYCIVIKPDPAIDRVK